MRPNWDYPYFLKKQNKQTEKEGGFAELLPLFEIF
jgi:hypothetical protein